jgi:NADH-quinone oxidoreductase subunit N
MTEVLITPFELRPLLPILLIVAGGIFALLLEAFFPKGRASLLLTLATILVALGLTATAGVGPDAFAGMLSADAFARYFDVILLMAALVAVLLSVGYVSELKCGEYYALILFATSGMMLLTHSKHLLLVFLGIETLSLALYVLTAFWRERADAVEAALKYFFLGSFAAAFTVYGMALIYGATGSLELHIIAVKLEGQESTVLALAGLGLMLVGFAFKLSLVPFHMWTPDAYQAAPTPVVAFMSIATKAATVAAMLRILIVGLPHLEADWVEVSAALAFITMLAGNLIALTQRSMKRMLAFSSIAHAGYMMVGFVGWQHGGTEAVLFYLGAYALMNLGAFAVLTTLEKDGQEVLLYDLAGLAERRPLIAASMAVFMLSLAGVPATIGFLGKLYLFMAAGDAGWVSLAVFTGLYSAIAAYYYLRVIVVMYMHPSPEGELVAAPRLLDTGLVVGLALGVVALGVLPSCLLDLVESSAILIP